MDWHLRIVIYRYLLPASIIWYVAGVHDHYWLWFSRLCRELGYVVILRSSAAGLVTGRSCSVLRRKDCVWLTIFNVVLMLKPKTKKQLKQEEWQREKVNISVLENQCRLFGCLFLFCFIFLFVYLFDCLSVCLSVSLSVWAWLFVLTWFNSANTGVMYHGRLYSEYSFVSFVCVSEFFLFFWLICIVLF